MPLSNFSSKFSEVIPTGERFQTVKSREDAGKAENLDKQTAPHCPGTSKSSAST